MADVFKEGIETSRFYSDSGDKEAVVKRDAYGMYFIEFYNQGNMIDMTEYPKLTFNTVEDIAEDYVSNGKARHESVE